MAGRTFVSIDLETTGLDSKRDAIIEVAAVRFQDAVVLDRFVAFVNPRRPIPPLIQQITGIRDADVAGAPSFAEIAPELRAFVGSDVAAVVAHNATFDMGFLRAQGVNLQRPVLDTLELATILLPGQASYSLAELCLHFQIQLVGAHRALADAEATALLLHHLNEEVRRLDPPTVQAVVSSAGDSDWPPLLLFSDALRVVQAERRAAGGRLRVLPSAAGPSASPDAPRTPLYPLFDEAGPTTPQPAAAIERLFAPGGPVAAAYGPEYESRAGQIEMARRVADAFNRGDHLMVEAGTGTGKSLAYLLPAARWAVANRRRVVVSTYTLTLQDQLLSKEIPRVANLLADEGQSLSAAVLKGRANYLCRRRLHEWRTSRRLNPAELSGLARILVWLPTTKTGDVSELALFTPADRELWQHVCSDPATCTPERCGHAAPPERQDFFHMARRTAEHAHLVVVNHALLLADVAADGRVLPPYTHLIVDEAHQLESAATDQLTYRFENAWLVAVLRRLVVNGELFRTLFDALLLSDHTEVHADLLRLAAAAAELLPTLRSVHEATLAFALQMEDGNDSGYAQRIALDGRVRSQPAWGELEIVWEGGQALLRQIVGHGQALARALAAARWPEAEPTAALYAELTGVFQKLEELLAHSQQIIYAPGGAQSRNTVCWLEVNDQRTQATLAEAPLQIADLVQRDLLHRRRTVIFTGATLRSGPGFHFIRERLGLWDVPAAVVESPFDYQQCALIYMPSDLVQPAHPGWQAGVERAIIDAADGCDGRTLVLFTSNAHLRWSADAVRAPLERLGVTVLQQGMGGRQKILRDFRRQQRAVLLGTRTFWEGVDLPGDELRCLIICRLPFAVPNDPLIAARSREFEDAFQEYMLPDAVLRFRQGFGRLIRRAGDRGVVVLLDSRVWRKEYGQVFLDALPACTLKHAPLSLLGEEVRKWLRR